jgi:hypothetical protein
MVNGSQAGEVNSIIFPSKFLRDRPLYGLLMPRLVMRTLDRISAGCLVLAGVSILVLFSALIMLPGTH